MPKFTHKKNATHFGIFNRQLPDQGTPLCVCMCSGDIEKVNETSTQPKQGAVTLRLLPQPYWENFTIPLRIDAYFLFLESV